MLRKLLHGTTREEGLSLAWLLGATAVLYKHLSSSTMRSVNSRAQGAEKYSRLVDHKNVSTQAWSEDKEGERVGVSVSVCVQAHRGEHFSPGDPAESLFSVKQVCCPAPDFRISFG